MRMVLTAGLLCAALLFAVTAAVQAGSVIGEAEAPAVRISHAN